MLAGSLPQFGVQDNPASFADSLCTRVMTYSYLAAFNCWLLLSPNVLSYDWQIGSIPLVESIGDVRNLATLSLYLILLLLVWRGFMSQVSETKNFDLLILCPDISGHTFAYRKAHVQDRMCC